MPRHLFVSFGDHLMSHLALKQIKYVSARVAYICENIC